MQAIFETIFDVVYLVSVIAIGIKMIINSKKGDSNRLFGIMAVVLGVGDSFHLIPRAYGLLTIGLEANARALGIGKLITSITMTVFYIILYEVWRDRYEVKGKNRLTASVYGLAAIRILICLFPQNQWLNYNQPVSWGIYRNIPFLIMGLIIIYIFSKKIKETGDKNFKNMPLAIVLSFALYMPVVLWANDYPLVGILMIPKTLAYVWIVFMGYKEFKEELSI